MRGERTSQSQPSECELVGAKIVEIILRANGELLPNFYLWLMANGFVAVG